jgi:hypothetical protein
MGVPDVDVLNAGVRVAAVRLTWKKRTETPEGGSSVIVRETGTVGEV